MVSKAYRDSQGLLIYPVEEVLEDCRKGKPIILVDAADRENEGDITVATECLTPETVNFMLQEGRGLICVSLSPDCAKRLQLPLQTRTNNSKFQTPFAISLDAEKHKSDGVTARARCETMKLLIDEESRAEDFVSPGHVFPLIANPEGVIGRQGQTEGCVDLARLAGLKPSGVICEVLAPEGTMRRGKDLQDFAEKHDLKITSVEELIRYRVQKEVFVRPSADEFIETDHGVFRVIVFYDDAARKEHLALVYGNPVEPVLVRVHSECLTGDVFSSRRCDCGIQLDESLKRIREEGSGVLLYLGQEGRGIGLLNKLKAYELQDKGHDTVDANLQLGFAADERDFVVAARMLENLGIQKLRLMTNNPKKLESLKSCGLEITERIPVVAEATEHSRQYLETKREKLGHLF